MNKPCVREDRALHTWITFPSEPLRRVYVQASAAIVSNAKDDPEWTSRLRLLIRALRGEQTAVEPKDE